MLVNSNSILLQEVRRWLNRDRNSCPAVLGRIRTFCQIDFLRRALAWNAGPRDANGQPGAYEAALEDNHTMHDPEQPIEVLRTIHSFDPCIACAVHMTDPDGKELTTVKVR